MKLFILKLLIIASALQVAAQDPTVTEIKKESGRKSAKDTILGWRTGGKPSAKIAAKLRRRKAKEPQFGMIVSIRWGS